MDPNKKSTIRSIILIVLLGVLIIGILTWALVSIIDIARSSIKTAVSLFEINPHEELYSKGLPSSNPTSPAYAGFSNNKTTLVYAMRVDIRRVDNLGLTHASLWFILEACYLEIRFRLEAIFNVTLRCKRPKLIETFIPNNPPFHRRIIKYHLSLTSKLYNFILS